MKLGLLFQGAAFLALLSGCRSELAPISPGMSAHLDQRIRGWYARRTGCGADTMTAKRVGSISNDSGAVWSIYEYRGCGVTNRVFTTCEFVDQCSEWTESIEPRAAHDLACSVGELKLKVLDKSTLAVDGCGQKVTYLSLPGGAWVMNNHGERASTQGGPRAE